ncbi:hypothetical protein VTN96DRAFT_2521 [Rasamsonia emersonii]
MLHKLPHEILLEIGSFLEQDSHIKLAQSSKYLYSFFLPLIYSNVSLGMTTSFCAEGFFPKPPLSLPVVRFTQTILQKPQLASLVHSLELFTDAGGWDVPTAEPLPSAFYEGIVRSACRSEGEFSQWLNDLIEGEEDAWLALLLVRLENLEKLTLPLPEPEYCPHLTRIIERAADAEPRYLSNLKNVFLREGPTFQRQGHMTIPRVLPFFQISSLRSFEAWDVAGGGCRLLELFDGTSTVTSIQLEYVTAGISYRSCQT